MEAWPIMYGRSRGGNKVAAPHTPLPLGEGWGEGRSDHSTEDFNLVNRHEYMINS